MASISKIKDAMTTAVEFVGIAIPAFRDGVQLTDAFEIYTKIKAHPVLAMKLAELSNDANAIREEGRNLDRMETAELILHAGSLMLDLVKKIKAEVAIPLNEKENATPTLTPGV